MNDYTEFDKAVLAQIAAGKRDFTHLYATRAVGMAAHQLAGPGKSAYRVLDKRLQALRKKGVIAYSSKKGWQIV